jgi:flagellar biosynthetic protein FlhB
VRDELEKTEPPTPHKIEEARERGFVPKSREIIGLAILLGIFIFLWFSGQKIFEGFQEGINLISSGGFSGSVLSYAVSIAVKIILPVLFLSAVIAILANVLQTGFLIATKSFEPKIEKFSPVENFQRIFSSRNLFEFAKSVSKSSIVLAIIGFILYTSLWKIDEFFGLDITSAIPKSAGIVLRFVAIVLVFLIFLSIADYAWQRWDWWRSLMMSRSELREEMRRYEGDPTVRSRVRRRMFELARLRMMAEVPRADVIITNPTHIAVALKYERGKMKAPKVVAKGMNFMAQRIVDVAKEHGVPIYQDPPLAWALYKSTNIGDYIPENLYKAVAKVLAYIIMLKQKQKG